MPPRKAAAKRRPQEANKVQASPASKKSAASSTKRSNTIKATVNVPAKKAESTKRKSVIEIDDTSDDEYSKRPVKKMKVEKVDCQICAEEKNDNEYNFPTIQSCNHNTKACKACITKHFQTRIEANLATGWDACTCPICAQQVSQEVARAVTTKTFQKEIDKKVNKKSEQSNKNFLWCPHEQCGHGQVHKVRSDAWVKCKKCRKKICFRHQRKWHEGMTCQEFDEAGDVDASIAKNEAELRRMTKPCPFCGARIQKRGGCNHMRCSSCSKEWWWDKVSFDGEDVATSAEFVGGPERVAPLHGMALANVNAAMEAANRATGEMVFLPQQAVVNRVNPPPVQAQMQAAPAPVEPPQLTTHHQPANNQVNIWFDAGHDNRGAEGGWMARVRNAIGRRAHRFRTIVTRPEDTAFVFSGRVFAPREPTVPMAGNNGNIENNNTINTAGNVPRREIIDLTEDSDD